MQRFPEVRDVRVMFQTGLVLGGALPLKSHFTSTEFVFGRFFQMGVCKSSHSLGQIRIAVATRRKDAAVAAKP